MVMNVDEAEIAALYRSATVIRAEKTKCIGNPAKSVDRHREILLVLDPQVRLELWTDFAMRLRVAGISPPEEAIRSAA